MSAEHALDILSGFASGIFRTSLAATLLAALIVTAQCVVGNRVSARLKYALWMLLIVRLVTPAVIGVHWRPALPPPAPVPAVNAPAQVNEMIADRVTQSPAIPPPIHHPIDWMRIVCLVWLTGIAVLALRILIAALRLRRQLQRLEILQDDKLDAAIDAGMRDLNLRRRPLVLAAPDGCGPALVGIFRPRLLIPRQCLDLSLADLRLVALHELAHQRRCDVAVGWLITFLQVLHWFNPFLWLAFARMRADRELACDETVLALEDRLGEDRSRAYGMMILNLVGVLSARPPVPGAVGIIEGTRSLQRRITMIARYDRRKFGLFPALAVALFLAAIGWVRAADAPPGATPAVPASSSADALPSFGADNSHVPVSDPTNPQAAQADADTVARLAQVIPALKLEGVTLDDALNFIRDTAGLNVTVDAKAIHAAGIDPKGAITVGAMKNITVDRALQTILRAAGGGTLDYDVEDGIVVISTTDALNQQLVTRVFDVTDLLSTSTTQPADAADNLIKAIESAVSPDSWRDQGGTIGSLQTLDKKLIATQSRLNMRRVVNFMDQLRHPIPSK